MFMDPSLWPENIFFPWWRNPRASNSPSPPSEIPDADDTSCFPPSPPSMISREDDDTCIPPSLPSSSSRADDDLLVIYKICVMAMHVDREYNCRGLPNIVTNDNIDPDDNFFNGLNVDSVY